MIVLDEPLASLDASAQAQLANLLVDLSRELGLGLLLISHDLAIVRHVADAVSVMYLGRMVETGPTAPLWQLPLHPYTEALIGAVPHADGTGFLPEALPGEVPGPGAVRRAAAASTRAARTPSTAAPSRSRRSCRSRTAAPPPAGSSRRARRRPPPSPDRAGIGRRRAQRPPAE